MSLSERFDLMSRQLEHQRLRIDELEDEVRLLKNKESVALELVSMIQQQQQQQPAPATRVGGGTPHRERESRGRQRSRSLSPPKLKKQHHRRSPSPVHLQQRRSPIDRRRSRSPVAVYRSRSRSPVSNIDRRRSRSPVAAAVVYRSRSRSPVSKKRHVSQNRSIHVSNLHHLNTEGRVPLTEALYIFFGSYGQVHDVYLADNEKWAKITFENVDDAGKFFDSYYNSSDSVTCAPFQSGGKGAFQSGGKGGGKARGRR